METEQDDWRPQPGDWHLSPETAIGKITAVHFAWVGIAGTAMAPTQWSRSTSSSSHAHLG